MNRWIRILLFADFFVLLAAGMLTPIYAIFVEKIGGDLLDASIAWAIFSFSSGFLLWIIGKWEDKVKHYVKLLVVGYFVRAIGFLGYLFVSNRYELFIVQLLIGIGASISLPSYDSLYSKYIDKKEYATEWGLWEGMNLMVAALAAIIGGLVATYLGFTFLFISMFALSIIGFFISLTLLKKKKLSNKNTPSKRL
ncbi:MFS transporter [Candidatus Pacearchaeota archaeon]|nr:MFS transporter [Candidatus Pacearchaeota archaeon]